MPINLNPSSWFSTQSTKQQIASLKGQLTKAENEFGINILEKNFAGINVNAQTAIGLDIVYSAIRDKAESIGQLPIVVKRKGKKLTKGMREHKIFSMTPNDYMTTQDLLEMYVTCMELYGNFYIMPVYNKYGNISELIPFRYQQNVATQMDANGRVYHTYTTNDGKPMIGFTGRDIIHIKLNSMDGVRGLSPISAAARTIGVAISQEQHLSSLMEKGARPSGILTTDAIFKDDKAIARVTKQWQETYGGSSNSGKTPLLENGLKYQGLSISPADSELIKQRVFSRIQLAGIFRVPLSRLGIVEAQKYKNLEENNKSYLKDSLNPLITKFQSGINNVLPVDLEIVIDIKQYARGDRKSQVEALGAELKLGGISIAEMREDLERDYIEGSDVFAIDTNNLTFGLLTDIPKLQEQARAAAKPVPKVTNDE